LIHCPQRREVNMADTQWTYPDGSQVTLHEDGSVTVKDTDGTVTHMDPAGNGSRTITPSGQQPTTDKPVGPPRKKDGETTFSFADGTRYRFKKGPPPRFQRVKSFGTPRTIEIDLTNGNRRLVPEENAKDENDKPTDTKKIEPSTHPKKEEPKPDDSKKDEPKADDSKKDEPKKDEPKKDDPPKGGGGEKGDDKPKKKGTPPRRSPRSLKKKPKAKGRPRSRRKR
jgi:hypothetical protein